MTEQILQAECNWCNHRWKPFGSNMKPLPYTYTVTCPACKHHADLIWTDDKTRVEHARKKLGLSPGDVKFKVLQERLAILEKQVVALQADRDAKTQVEQFVRTEIEKVKQEAKEKDERTAQLEEQLKSLKEQIDFMQNNK